MHHYSTFNQQKIHFHSNKTICNLRIVTNVTKQRFFCLKKTRAFDIFIGLAIRLSVLCAI